MSAARTGFGNPSGTAATVATWPALVPVPGARTSWLRTAAVTVSVVTLCARD